MFRAPLSERVSHRDLTTGQETALGSVRPPHGTAAAPGGCSPAASAGPDSGAGEAAVERAYVILDRREDEVEGRCPAGTAAQPDPRPDTRRGRLRGATARVRLHRRTVAGGGQRTRLTGRRLLHGRGPLVRGSLSGVGCRRGRTPWDGADTDRQEGLDNEDRELTDPDGARCHGMRTVREPPAAVPMFVSPSLPCAGAVGSEGVVAGSGTLSALGVPERQGGGAARPEAAGSALRAGGTRLGKPRPAKVMHAR
ncbi:hypothetical protein GCM10010282_37320 [Streptomyces roseolus]|nr:hypothetical protein GCM10010282_37320 [Streptomyces roseolus]